MSDRPRLFDDLAGVAGGAISALAGVREEVNALVRSRVDEVLGQLQVVRREEFEVVREMAARARMAGEEAEQRIAALERRVADLENRLTQSGQNTQGGYTQDSHPQGGYAPAPDQNGNNGQSFGWSGDDIGHAN